MNRFQSLHGDERWRIGGVDVRAGTAPSEAVGRSGQRTHHDDGPGPAVLELSGAGGRCMTWLRGSPWLGSHGSRRWVRPLCCSSISTTGHDRTPSLWETTSLGAIPSRAVRRRLATSRARAELLLPIARATSQRVPAMTRQWRTRRGLRRLHLDNKNNRGRTALARSREARRECPTDRPRPTASASLATSPANLPPLRQAIKCRACPVFIPVAQVHTMSIALLPIVASSDLVVTYGKKSLQASDLCDRAECVRH